MDSHVVPKFRERCSVRGRLGGLLRHGEPSAEEGRALEGYVMKIDLFTRKDPIERARVGQTLGTAGRADRDREKACGVEASGVDATHSFSAKAGQLTLLSDPPLGRILDGPKGCPRPREDYPTASCMTGSGPTDLPEYRKPKRS